MSVSQELNYLEEGDFSRRSAAANIISSVNLSHLSWTVHTMLHHSGMSWPALLQDVLKL